MQRLKDSPFGKVLQSAQVYLYVYLPALINVSLISFLLIQESFKGSLHQSFKGTDVVYICKLFFQVSNCVTLHFK